MPPAEDPVRVGRLARIARLSASGILLVIGIAYLVAGAYMNLVVVGPGLANRAGTRVGADFSAFYTVAHEVLAGRARTIYSEDALRRAHAEAVGGEVPPYQWAYPPSFTLLLAPIGSLPPLPAYWTWVCGSLVALTLCLYAMVGYGPMIGLAILFPGIVHSVICNPTGVANAALVAGAMAALGPRPLAAGICFGLLMYKPHLAFLAPVCLVAGGHRRAAGAFVATTLAVVGASVLAFGVEAWSEFLRAAQLNVAHVVAGRLPLDRMPTVYAAVLSGGASPATALAAQTATTVVVLLAAGLVWRRAARPSIRALALAAAVPLATPYGYDYDMAMLVVPFVLLADERRRGAPVPAWALALLWLAPLGTPLLAADGWYVGPVVLAVLLGLAGRTALAAPSPA